MLAAGSQSSASRTQTLARKAGAFLAALTLRAVIVIAFMGLLVTCLTSSFRSWWRSTLGPLQGAAYDADVDGCVRLVQSGVSVDSADDRGMTALGYAIYGQRVEAVRTLIELGADVNHADSLGLTPLIYTAHAPFGKGPYSPETASTRSEIARLLLEHGADVNHAQAGGDTALHSAVMNRDLGLARVFLAAGADTKARTAHRWTWRSSRSSRRTRK